MITHSSCFILPFLFLRRSFLFCLFRPISSLSCIPFYFPDDCWPMYSNLSLYFCLNHSYSHITIYLVSYWLSKLLVHHKRFFLLLLLRALYSTSAYSLFAFFVALTTWIQVYYRSIIFSRFFSVFTSWQNESIVIFVDPMLSEPWFTWWKWLAWCWITHEIIR